jgi:hypothetical protein
VFIHAESLGKFPVLETTEEAPPKNLHEAAEKGQTNMAVRMIERTIDFDINQRVSLATVLCSTSIALASNKAVLVAAK